MTTFIRTSLALPGKTFELLEAAKISAVLAERLIGVEYKVFTGFGGTVGEIAVIATFGSIAEIEAAGRKLGADGDWRAAASRNQLLTVPGSTHDRIWNEV